MRPNRLFTLCINFVIYAICTTDGYGKNDQWTEEKEARRIQMIKDEEKRLFKMELSGQPGYNPEMYDDRFLGSGDNSYEQGGLGAPIYGPAWATDKKGSSYKPQPPSQRQRSPSYKQEPAQIQSLPLISPSQGGNNKTNWCFYCASPLRILSSDLKKAIENLLRVRRTQYPYDAVNEKCSSPENINALPKQQCMHSYCQTLTLVDHQTATAFTMRGCAENFAAVNMKILERREDNTCEKLHDHIDLQECICKHRKYCYKGAERKGLYVEDDSNLFPFYSNGYARSLASSSNHFLNRTFGFLCLVITSFICLLYV